MAQNAYNDIILYHTAEDESPAQVQIPVHKYFKAELRPLAAAAQII
jgi:hypothetical protein